jgi:adenosylcobyric acid synthase
MQLLGREILDPFRLESGHCSGLGLLDLTTTLSLEKTTRQRAVQWGGILVHGYEIHHGRTQASPRVESFLPDSLGWRQGNVSGVYLHGLFENAVYRQHFLQQLGWGGHTSSEWSATVETSINRVAQLIPDSGWTI